MYMYLCQKLKFLIQHINTYYIVYMFISSSMRLNNNTVFVYLCLLWTKHFPTISAVVLAFGEWEPNGAGMALFYTIVLYPVIRDHSTWLISYGPVVHSTFVLANKHRTVIPEHMKGRKPQLSCFIQDKYTIHVHVYNIRNLWVN